MDWCRHGPATHTVVTVHQVCAEALRSGIRAAEWRILTGLDPAELTDFARRVPATQLFQVWEAVMRRLDDPGFPVRAARAAGRDARSAVYFLAAASASVREGIATSVANVSAWTTAYTVTAADRHGDIALTIDGLDPARLGARCEAEFQIADFLTSLRLAMGEGATPTRVAFAHPAPRDTAEHRAYFGPGLEFGAPHTEITMPAHLLDRPVPTAQPGLATVLADHVATLRASHDVPASHGVRLRDWFLVRFRTGESTTAAAAARSLALSERTLHRRLAEEGTTFTRVRETTRRQYAVDLVRTTPRALKEIASLVGFADSRAFHRAYLRWTGTTPGQDRLARR